VQDQASAIEAFLWNQLAISRGVGADEVRTEVADAGGIDSLEGIELILAAEWEYGVEIPDDSLSSRVCRSLPALARLINSKLVS
jgi:acyl carrier protein